MPKAKTRFQQVPIKHVAAIVRSPKRQPQTPAALVRKSAPAANRHEPYSIPIRP